MIERNKTKYLAINTSHGSQWVSDIVAEEVGGRALFIGESPVPTYIQIIQEKLNLAQIAVLKEHYPSAFVEVVSSAQFEQKTINEQEVSRITSLLSPRRSA